MQQNKKGSILLYVLFLSSFLVLFFVSFQGELENMLDGAKNSEKSIREMSSIQDIIIFLKNAPTGVKTMDSNKHLSFISLNQSGTLFTETLGGDSSEEYWITSTGGSNSITLNITLGGPIFYNLSAFNSGSETSSIPLSSGVIMTGSIINLSPALNQHILVVNPLGGYVQYTLDASATTTIPSVSSYKLERDIQGYKKDEGVYPIVNFIPKSRTGIDYQKMGMYLKK